LLSDLPSRLGGPGLGFREAPVPTIYDIKPKFQALLRPVTRALWKCGVTANQVTLAALVLSSATGACLGLFPAERWSLLLMAPMLFLRMALNAIDGMLAREHGMKTDLGAILNEIGDVASDSALYLPLALVPGFNGPLVVIAVLLAVFTEMTGVVGVQLSSVRSYKGPMGKSDRAFVFGAMALLIGLGVPTGGWVTGVLVLMVCLLGVTILNRGREALRIP
jgi:phosphatidylglycerophosphate synthase